MAALCWLLQLTPKTLCIKYQFFSLYKHIVHPTPHDVGKTKSGKSLIPVRSAERRSGVNSWENAWVSWLSKNSIDVQENCQGWILYERRDVPRRSNNELPCLSKERYLHSMQFRKIENGGVFPSTIVSFMYALSGCFPVKLDAMNKCQKGVALPGNDATASWLDFWLKFCLRTVVTNKGRSKIKIDENRMLFNASWAVA